MNSLLNGSFMLPYETPISSRGKANYRFTIHAKCPSRAMRNKGSNFFPHNQRTTKQNNKNSNC